MRAVSLCLVGGIALAVACSGRATRDAEPGDGPDDQPGAGLAKRSGGANAAGGSASYGGAAAIGGFGMAATGASGASCACQDIECAPGFVQTSNPDGCCDVCVPLPCDNVFCAGTDCGSGSHIELLPGDCCPVCVSDIDVCEAGRFQYNQFLGQVVGKYASLGCKSTLECGALRETNRCGSSCGISLPAAVIDEATASLREFAEETCASCRPLPEQPCVPPSSVSCFQGRCIFR